MKKSKLELYEEIRTLTAELDKLGLPKDIMSHAKNSEATPKSFDKYIIKLKKSHAELFQRLEQFYTDCVEYEANGEVLKIFYCDYNALWVDDNKQYYKVKYNPKEIKPISLLTLFVFSKGRLKREIFCDYLSWMLLFDRYGYKELTAKMRERCTVISSIYDLFKAFKQYSYLAF